MRKAFSLVACLMFCATLARAEAPATADCEQLARAYVDAVNAGRAKPAADLFDMDAVINASLKDVQAPPAFVKGFSEGLQEKGISSMIEQLHARRGALGGMRYLRMVERDGETRALVRFVGDEGLNYHEYCFGTTNGKPVLTDMYVWSTGEKVTATFKRVATQALEAGRGGARTSPQLQAMQTMSQAVREQRWPDAIMTYDKLPPDVQKDKILQILRIRAAFTIDEKLYAKALDEYANTYKNDVSLDLMLLDTFLQKKDYAEALACLDRLDKSVGGDPCIGVVRCETLILKGDRPAGIAAARAALKQEPTLLPASAALLKLALDEKDHAGAKQIMLQMERQTDFRFGDLKGVEYYADFVKSPSYTEWMNERPKN